MTGNSKSTKHDPHIRVPLYQYYAPLGAVIPRGFGVTVRKQAMQAQAASQQSKFVTPLGIQDLCAPSVRTEYEYVSSPIRGRGYKTA